MNILVIGTDNSALDENSRLYERILDYGGLVDKYHCIVPAKANVHKVVSDKIELYGVSGLWKPIILLKIYLLIRSKLIKDSFDVLSVQDPYYLALISYLACLGTKTALEIQVHGYEKYTGLRKIIAQYLLKKADSIRTVSYRLKDSMVAAGISDDKITVIPMFTPISDSQESAVRDNNKVIFFTACRLVPVKNINLQLQAMTDVVKRHQNIELWIAGEGPLRQKLEAASQQFGLDGYVKFLGWQKSLEKYYNAADVFVLTSYSEGWPLVINESAGRGLAIIMTDVGSAGRLIINDESGLVIPINDKAALAKAMERLIVDQTLRRSLGQNAKANFGKLADKKQTLDLYVKSWETARLNKTL